MKSSGGGHAALEDIYNDRLKETGKTGADAWIGFGSIHLVWELGKRIGKPNSLIYWAWKNQVPVCIPNHDGSIGAQLFMFRQSIEIFTSTQYLMNRSCPNLTWDVDQRTDGRWNIETSRHLVESIPRWSRCCCLHYHGSGARWKPLRHSITRSRAGVRCVQKRRTCALKVMQVSYFL